VKKPTTISASRKGRVCRTKASLTRADRYQRVCNGRRRTLIDATGIDATGIDATGIDATGIDATGIDATGTISGYHAGLNGLAEAIS
jgi:hypothetical protein